MSWNIDHNCFKDSFFFINWLSLFFLDYKCNDCDCARIEPILTRRNQLLSFPRFSKKVQSTALVSARRVVKTTVLTL